MLSNRLVDRNRVRSVQFESLKELPSEVGGNLDEGTESIEREAFAKGFEAGRISGLEMAEKRVEAILSRFSESLEQLAATRREIMVETQRDLVRLAVEIARKLVHREIQVDEEIVITLVRLALERLSSEAVVTVILNPEDHAFLQARLEADSDLFGEGELLFKAKSDLRRGDCLLESCYGNVDARISEKFRQIEQGLLSEF